MNEYSPPIEDIEFLLTEILELNEICSFPGFEDFSLSLVSVILKESAKFAVEILAPLNQLGDQEGARLQDGIVRTPTGWTTAYQKFVAAGWPSLIADPKYGGQGLPRVVGASVQEMWDAANMAFGLCPMLTQTAAELISFQGTSEQKNLYLSNLVSGKWAGTMNLTEPQAGSDLSAIQTKAIRGNDDQYLIKGQKIFITYGDHDLTENIIHLVLARVPGAPAGVKGISLFIVPKFLMTSYGEITHRNDVRTVSIEKKMGIHGSPTAVLAYGENEGAIGFLLGEENRGLEYMFVMMNMARHAVGIEAYAIADRAYQSALRFSAERVQGKDANKDTDQRVSINQHPDVARMLLEIQCRVEAMRSLSLYVASELDRANYHPDEKERQRHQGVVDILIPVVKGWNSEVSNNVVGQVLQVFGGIGFIEETGIGQFYRDARITTIYEGTSGIQAADLVRRKLLIDDGKMIWILIRQIKDDISKVPEFSEWPQLAEICRSMDDGIAKLERATEWIKESSSRDQRLPLAGSFPYLMLWGTVMGGWLMLRSGHTAVKKLQKDSDCQFYVEKLTTTRCYMQYVLSQCTSYATAIEMGSELVIDRHKSSIVKN